MPDKPKCVLTGYHIKGENFVTIEGPVVEYVFHPVGRVKIAHPTYVSFLNDPKPRPLLAGICRNRFEKNEAPILINQDFLENGIKSHVYPKEFMEKVHHLLTVLYNKGGKNYKNFDLHSSLDFPLCYCDNDEEFERIIEYLHAEKKFITYWGKPDPSGRYYIKLTELGIKEAEKGLPQVPLIGLVNQIISTGNSEIDSTINHAKELFHFQPPSMEKMRSACESLCYVLEPLRDKLELHLKHKDVQDFFNIVNNFDIRHNKEYTKEIKSPEQLEWVYYSLLNTINMYTKLQSFETRRD